MFVSDWMTKKVQTITPDDFISDAVKIMKENCIRHLPAVKGERIKGIISDRDIKEFTPSAASTLDIYELHYLLAKTKVKEIITSKVITTTPDTPIEEAAMVLYDSLIGCLPVAENGKLVGIISDRDIFRALIDITGVRYGGNRISLSVEDRPGSIKEVADVVRKYGYSLLGILTSYAGAHRGRRNVVIRTRGKGSFIGLKNELEKLCRDVAVRKEK